VTPSFGKNVEEKVELKDRKGKDEQKEETHS
jgi:hypothetical protein